MVKSLAEKLREVSNEHTQTFEKDIKDIVAKCHEAAETGMYEINISSLDINHGEFEEYADVLNNMGLTIHGNNEFERWRAFTESVKPLLAEYVISWK